MSALTEDAGFRFTTLVEAQRGMTDAEADQFLLTGVMPDLSLPPTEPEVPDEEIRTDAEARDFLAGFTGMVASGSDIFLAQAESHSAAFKFDPNQPRDKDGKWSDGLDTVNLPKLPTQQKNDSTVEQKTTGGGLGSGKKAIPAVIYKKHADGTVVAESADGQRRMRRMRWASTPRKFVVDENKDGSWQETEQLNKTSAYNDLKNPDKWFEPGQTDINNEPSTSAQTPEPEAPVVEPDVETHTQAINDNVRSRASSTRGG